IAFRAGAPCRVEPLADRQAVTLVFNCCGVDRQKFMDYIKEDPATYNDWGEDWAQQTSGLENDMFSPYFQKQFDQAISEKIIEDTEFDLCGSWSTITDDGQATYLNLVHLRDVDVTDCRELTRAEMSGRAQVLEAIKAMNHTIPGWEKARLRNYAMSLGTRDSRKIVGVYDMVGKDVMEEGRFEDSIGIFPEFVDGFGVLRLPVTGRYFQVPYGAILPKRMENLLVAGRSISGDQISHAATRNMMCCAVSGQGAGAAAATAVKQGTTVRKVAVADIQKTLADQGVRCQY
ncbi:MAG: FAD-dependent oxidoreductase, partial [Desulfobacterales bacterium]|nr:FAD-dependent oxidoreductase [Desulfobacterales bacterium]